MARSVAWKNLEKTVATVLGGVRIHRGGDFSESLPDVICSTERLFGLPGLTHAIVAECKYRQRQPWINAYKQLVKSCNLALPVYATRINTINPLTELEDKLILVSLDGFHKYFEHMNSLLNYIPNNIKTVPSYIQEYCIQPRLYINNLDIRYSLELLYKKAMKSRTIQKFESYSSISVLGQKNDKVRLVIFYESEFSKILNAKSNR